MRTSRFLLPALVGPKAATMEARPTVFLVDDDPAILRVLSRVIESLGLTPAAFSSADEFLTVYQPAGAACLVLDVRMPGMSGLELQRHLAAAGDSMPIIFITAHADVRMAVEAMERGAHSFLEKPIRMQELCDKIQEAIRLTERAWERRLERENAASRLAALTPAERRVLDLVVAGDPNRTIAGALGLSVRTVEVHRSRIIKKLKLKSRTDLLKLVQAAGQLDP